MSEYQYYEWLAIDRPLNAKQLKEVGALSSHMDTVAPTQASVTYSFGDFKHDPLKVLTLYFDAFLYVANWGTQRLAFSFPKAAIPLSAIDPYLIEGVITVTNSGPLMILDIAINEEGGDSDWIEADGLLAQVAGVRQQLIRGDYRALYLIWLALVLRGADSDGREDADEYEDEGDDDIDPTDFARSTEPPVPAGLHALDGSLTALCNLFGVDMHLVKAAAASSAKVAKPTASAVRLAIARLPRERADAYLFQLINDELQLSSALLKELGLGATAPPQQTGKGRTGKTLLEVARRLAKSAQQRDQEEAKRARIAALEKLATREDSAWEAVEPSMHKQTAAGYDAAVEQLVDLRDLAEHRNTSAQFEARLSRVVAEFGRSSALMKRLRAARLV